MNYTLEFNGSWKFRPGFNMTVRAGTKHWEQLHKAFERSESSIYLDLVDYSTGKKALAILVCIDRTSFDDLTPMEIAANHMARTKDELLEKLQAYYADFTPDDTVTIIGFDRVEMF